MKGAMSCGYARMEDLGCAVELVTGRFSMRSGLSTFMCFLSNFTRETTSLGLKKKRRNNSQFLVA